MYPHGVIFSYVSDPCNPPPDEREPLTRSSIHLSCLASRPPSSLLVDMQRGCILEGLVAMCFATGIAAEQRGKRFRRGRIPAQTAPPHTQYNASFSIFLRERERERERETKKLTPPPFPNPRWGKSTGQAWAKHNEHCREKFTQK